MIDGWKLVKAVDFINFNPKEKLEKGAITKKISMEQLYPFTRDIFSYELAPFSGGSKFRNGDTLMARITPCLENGKTSQVNILDNEEIGFGSTEFIVLREIPNVSDRNFIYYLAISSILRDKAIKSMVGSSGRQRVQQGVINDIEFFVPPLDEQKRIASILSALDDKIELNKKINKTLEEMAKAIFKSWFVDFEPWGGKMPGDWKEGNLIDIANIVMGQSPEGASYNKNGIGTVFYQGRAEFGFRYPKRNLFTVKPKRIASEDDVLMSVRAPVGDFNIAFERCCIGRGLASIRSINSYQSYIFYLMLTLRRRLDMFDCEGTVFGSINKNSIENLPVIIPSDNIICVFEKLINPVDSVIKKNYIENIHLSSLRDTLLPKLMSGEIRVK